MSSALYSYNTVCTVLLHSQVRTVISKTIRLKDFKINRIYLCYIFCFILFFRTDNNFQNRSKWLTVTLRGWLCAQLLELHEAIEGLGQGGGFIFCTSPLHTNCYFDFWQLCATQLTKVKIAIRVQGRRTEAMGGCISPPDPAPYTTENVPISPLTPIFYPLSLPPASHIPLLFSCLPPLKYRICQI